MARWNTVATVGSQLHVESNTRPPARPAANGYLGLVLGMMEMVDHGF